MRANFVAALDALLDAGSYVGIATHDEWLLDEGRRSSPNAACPRRVRVPDAARRPAELRGRARAEGHRLRIYVPFGRHWYDYSLRRLQENPKIAGYIAADTLGRLIGRNGA